MPLSSLRTLASARALTALAALCLLLAAGCGGEPEEEEEPITFIDEGAETMIPVMLNNKTVRKDGFARRLRFGDIYDVDVVGARAAGVHAVLLDPYGEWPDADCERFTDVGALAETLVRARSER